MTAQRFVLEQLTRCAGSDFGAAWFPTLRAVSVLAGVEDGSAHDRLSGNFGYQTGALPSPLHRPTEDYEQAGRLMRRSLEVLDRAGNVDRAWLVDVMQIIARDHDAQTATVPYRQRLDPSGALLRAASKRFRHQAPTTNKPKPPTKKPSTRRRLNQKQPLMRGTPTPMPPRMPSPLRRREPHPDRVVSYRQPVAHETSPSALWNRLHPVWADFGDWAAELLASQGRDHRHVPAWLGDEHDDLSGDALLGLTAAAVIRMALTGNQLTPCVSQLCPNPTSRYGKVRYRVKVEPLGGLPSTLTDAVRRLCDRPPIDFDSVRQRQESVDHVSGLVLRHLHLSPPGGPLPQGVATAIWLWAKVTQSHGLLSPFAYSAAEVWLRELRCWQANTPTHRLTALLDWNEQYLAELDGEPISGAISRADHGTGATAGDPTVDAG